MVGRGVGAREIAVTRAELHALRELEVLCWIPFGFNERRWADGVRRILGDRSPPADYRPSRLVVTPAPTPTTSVDPTGHP